MTVAVYDMRPDGRDEQEWVWFFTKHQPVMPLRYDECAGFFKAHPRIEIDRNTDSTPRSSKAKLPDFSNLSHSVHPVFSQRAKDIFAPRLEGLGTWVELVYDEAPYWLFHITNVVDALHFEKAEVSYFKDGGFKRVESFAFEPDVVKSQFLFTLPQQPGSNRLVTDEFIKVVRQHKLTGFIFERLWSDTLGPVRGLKDYEKPRYTGLGPHWPL
jgi:hypothetical protein